MPKEGGGLGLRSLFDLSKAFLPSYGGNLGQPIQCGLTIGGTSTVCGLCLLQ